jgi:hypothetical protein
MNIESITQETIAADEIVTRVVINQVESQCILLRLIIGALGRPGVDNDMEVMSAGDKCIFLWTQPALSLTETRALIERTIAPSSLKASA